MLIVEGWKREVLPTPLEPTMMNLKLKIVSAVIDADRRGLVKISGRNEVGV
jgi:hypothetical protein